MRRRLVPTLLAAVTVLVAGCGGGLSTGGPVEQGLVVGSGDPPDIRVFFPGPLPGANQESIVAGFVRAGAASDAAYDNARAFLTTAVSDDWNPDGTIVLLADDVPPSATLLDPATVRITAEAAGTVDANGRHTAAAPGTTVTATFGVSTVGGEWRISTLPKGFGRWIASTEVTRLVQPYAVHYVSTSRRALVPDVRWFPSDKLATRLARAQLVPVPDHLAGAATTAVPAGARLLGDAVSVEGGIATVNLISSRLGAGEANRQNLWAQFVRTLSQDTAVTRVALSVNGVPVDLDGLDGTAGSLTEVRFRETPPAALANPVVRRGDEVVVFDPAGLGQQEPRQPAGSRTYPAVKQSYRHLALSPDGTELAGVDPGGDGISRWKGTNQYEVPLDGVDVGNPSYDTRGFLWMGAVGEGGDGTRLWVVATGANPADPTAAAAQPVQADWLKGRRVLESRLSPGGDLVAVVSTLANGSDLRVDLAGVMRAGGSLPQRLAPPLRIGSSLQRATGLAWLDDRTLVTLGVLRGAPQQPTVIGIGGDVRALTPAPGGVAISSTGGERDLWVVTNKGRLLGRAGSQWVDSGPATDLAVAAG
ncbi:MAG: hypothetical protein K0R30_2394 [Ornithinibacter sp.]|jgi:hypothetical protein|nr:hypothetical protein [Ornithinibacter sp.]